MSDNEYVYKVFNKAKGEFQKGGLSTETSRFGKIWLTAGHLKAAIRNRFGSFLGYKGGQAQNVRAQAAEEQQVVCYQLVEVMRVPMSELIKFDKEGVLGPQMCGIDRFYFTNEVISDHPIFDSSELDKIVKEKQCD